MWTNNNDHCKRETNSQVSKRKMIFEVAHTEGLPKQVKVLENYKFMYEILFRCILIFFYLVLAKIPPFHIREIQSQELWLYSYPSEPRILPGRLFYPLVLVIPLCAIWWFYQTNEDDVDVIEGFLSVTLSFSVTLFSVEILKNIIGRPRPNFLAKCFPDGNLSEDLICKTGTFYDIQSRKSFPSGHAALTFSSMTFVSFYLGGKMKTFSSNSEHPGVKLFTFLLPLMFGTVISLTAFCDYHHHWEDIFVGSIIGFVTTWLCYYLYYPHIINPNCDMSNKVLQQLNDIRGSLNEKSRGNTLEKFKRKEIYSK